MRLLSRTIFREIFASSFLGVILFTFVLFVQRSSFLFEFLVRNSDSPRQVAYVFVLVLPQVLPFTIPLGVLVGTLLTLSRMSTDGEITAMRAAGVPSRRVVPPILTFAILAMLVAAAASLWLTPWSIRERYRVQNQLIASQLTADVQPRVFAEQFPNSILYVSDVLAGTTSRWRRIFLADVTPPESRAPGAAERGDSPLITLATDALAVPDVALNRIQLSLHNGSTYTVGKDSATYNITQSPTGDQVLQARRQNEKAPSRPASEMDTVPLYRMAYRDPSLDKTAMLDTRIELHQRLALPLACVLLALTGVPLGITSRRAGKSSAVVLTLGLAMLYYMGLISLIKLAQMGTLPPGIALWIPNVLFATAGLILLTRLELPGDLDVIGRILAVVRRLGRGPREQIPAMLERVQTGSRRFRFPLLLQVLDRHIVLSFLFYFLVSLVTFVMMYHVFTFFDLLSDIIKNHISLGRLVAYHFFLTPRLLYDFTPIAVLVAVLVIFGLLTKHNEVTAFKACGVSVFRLAAPVFLTGLVLSGSLFAFDHYWVPESDRRQDALRAEIKGKPAQTFLRPDRKWIYGLRDRVFYYKYFDQTELMMVGVNVYEIDPVQFRLQKHIFAERARWEPSLNRWSFQNGWIREINGDQVTRIDDFSGGIRVFPEIQETPDYFVKEVKQSKQMNFRELKDYIGELQQGGLDTVPLQVQFYKKFSVPLFAFIMVMVSVPFAFLAGNRGAMAGVGISFAILITYLSVNQLFEQVGNLGQLPAAVAAWSPDAVFSLFGLYFLTRLKT
jgi:LPS export ABC transporter permease LptG/LPS export ABC transporter permease LptF